MDCTQGVVKEGETVENEIITVLSGAASGICAILFFEWRFSRHLKEDYVEPLVEPIRISVHQMELSMGRNMERLEKSIEKMEVVCEQDIRQQADMSERIAVLNAKVDFLHRRLDLMDERINEFAHFCNCEHKGDMAPDLLARITRTYPAENPKGGGRP